MSNFFFLLLFFILYNYVYFLFSIFLSIFNLDSIICTLCNQVLQPAHWTHLLVLAFNQVFSLILPSFVFCNFVLPWLPSSSQGSSASPPADPHPFTVFLLISCKSLGFFFLSRLPLITSATSTNSPTIFEIKSV